MAAFNGRSKLYNDRNVVVSGTTAFGTNAQKADIEGDRLGNGGSR